MGGHLGQEGAWPRTLGGWVAALGLHSREGGPRKNAVHAVTGVALAKDGRVDGGSIRASNNACTLSLTREPSSAPAASSPYDGTYLHLACFDFTSINAASVPPE